MDWDYLRTFHAIAKTGSLSAAARLLKSSQPTVGRQIAALEAEIGQKLFQRQRNGMVLTPTGESILDAVRDMERAATTARRRLEGKDRAFGGAVRISVTEGLGVHFLPHGLAPFRRANPEITVDIAIANTAADLDRREADIAIRLFRPVDGELIVRRAGRLQFGLYAAPSYLRKRGTPTQLTDLSQHDLIGFDAVPGRFPQVDLLHRLAGGRPFALRSNSMLAQMEAARAGHGIALINTYSAAHIGGLKRLLPAEVSPSYEIWLVVHRDLRHVPRISLVYDELVRLLKANAGRLTEDG